MLLTAAAPVDAGYREYSANKSISASGLKSLFGFDENPTSSYHPIVLNEAWSGLLRLVIMFTLASYGTVINVFYISSFFVQKYLKKPRNVYMGCIGFSDMIITGGVVPIATVYLISNHDEISPTCYFLQILAVGSTYAYSLLFMMISIENYIRICRTRACYTKYLSVPGCCIAFLIFTMSYIASAVGVHYGLNYDYCNRKSHGHYTFRLLALLFFYGIPFTCTMTLFIWTCLVVRARSIRLARYQRAWRYKRDYKSTCLNLICYCLFVSFWLPYLVMVTKYPNTSDRNYYYVVWCGLFRSFITSLLYCISNKYFREAYVKLFYYCFCKTSLTISSNQRRHRRPITTEIKPEGANEHVLQNIGPIAEQPTLAGPSGDIQTTAM